MGVLISLLSSFLPYIIGIIGVVGGYLFIKHKGVSEERERQKAEQAEAVIKLTEKVTEAVSLDSAIDTRVKHEIEEKREEIQSNSEPTAPNKFRF